MTTQAIQIDVLAVSYGPRRALEDLTLTIVQGEVFGLLGHNGAGKTTTVNILTTLLPRVCSVNGCVAFVGARGISCD
jgi:ABC-2 type transport system ATP-binding protein